jgi:hypothetical protein
MKGAARSRVLAMGVAVVLAVALAAARSAIAAESTNVTDADRTYRSFIPEAATVAPGQVRLEIRGMTLNDEGGTRLNLLGFPVREAVHSETGGIIETLGSYGLGKSGELGFDVPVFIQSQRLRMVDSKGNETFQSMQNEDVGDVQLYTKFKRMVAEHCAVAGGVQLSLPTGIERKGFGTGELGVNPFLSTRYQNGRLAVGAHVGYEMYTGGVEDVLNYSIEAIVRGSSEFALRAELSGRYFRAAGQQFNDAVVMPGIDYNLTSDLTIRPTGLANVTDEAIDWGLGLGIAYVF